MNTNPISREDENRGAWGKNRFGSVHKLDIDNPSADPAAKCTHRKTTNWKEMKMAGGRANDNEFCVPCYFTGNVRLVRSS